jgi:hypothetical protein
MREQPIRPVQAVRRAGITRVDPQLSDLQEARRLAPLLGLIAEGTVPTAGHEAAVGRAITALWEKETADGMGAPWTPK